jgi:hypothetical protein
LLFGFWNIFWSIFWIFLSRKSLNFTNNLLKQTINLTLIYLPRWNLFINNAAYWNGNLIFLVYLVLIFNYGMTTLILSSLQYIQINFIFDYKLNFKIWFFPNKF